MSNSGSRGASPRLYWITSEGIAAVNETESCRCRPQINGGFLECLSCGTVYAQLSQMSMGLVNDRKRA